MHCSQGHQFPLGSGGQNGVTQAEEVLREEATWNTAVATRCFSEKRSCALTMRSRMRISVHISVY